jgi:hypothetical protein
MMDLFMEFAIEKFASALIGWSELLITSDATPTGRRMVHPYLSNARSNPIAIASLESRRMCGRYAFYQVRHRFLPARG